MLPQKSKPTETSILPEFLRLPPPKERCRYTGLSRTTLCELTIPSLRNRFNPPVRSYVIKGIAATRGVRLIDRQSLFDYLRSLPNGVPVALKVAATEKPAA